MFLLGKIRPFSSNIVYSDADAALWAAAVVSAGGTVSIARQSLVARMIIALKAGGSWALDDDIWLLTAENATQALVSLKQRRLATVTNAPTFTVDRGYAFDGSTNFIDTGFICNTHAVAMSATTNRIAVYERTNVNASTYAAGATSTTARQLRVRPRNTSSCLIDNISNNSNFTLPVADSRGYTVGSRTGADVTNHLGFKNGVSMTRNTDATSFGASLPLVSMFIGGHNTTGTLTTPRASTCGLLTVGAALSSGQELAEYNAIQQFMTSIGANV